MTKKYMFLWSKSKSKKLLFENYNWFFKKEKCNANSLFLLEDLFGPSYRLGLISDKLFKYP